MKILFIGPMKTGGIATINREVQRVVSEVENIEYYSLENFATLKKRKINRIIEYFLLYLVSFWKIIFYKPNVVYLQISQTGYFHQSIFLLIAKILGRKTIAHFHAKPDVSKNVNFLNKKVIMWSQYYIDKLITLTESEKKSLQDNEWNKEIYVVPNFIDNVRLPKQVLPVNERKYILYIGRMHEQKGIFEILDIARNISDEHFVFIGDFPDIKTKNKFISKMKLLNNCKWLGPIYDKSKYNYIKNAKILLFPTRWQGEVFPLTIVECSLLGVIPIVHPVGAISEIIKDRYNGFYISIKSPERTSEKIKSILANFDLMQEVSNNCVKESISKYTAHSVKDGLIRIVKNW